MRYDYDSMEMAAEEIDGANKQFENSVNDLEARTRNLIQQSAGSSIETFDQKSKKITENFMDMSNQVNAMKNNAQDVYHEMQQLDSHLAAQ
jgi:uncharacterized protein YukE